MGKGLSQITFDFAPSEEHEKEEIPATTVSEETIPIETGNEVAAKEEHVVEAKKPLTGKRGRKSLKEIAMDADLLLIPDDETLFQKQYYSIGEVAGMFKENQSLIRYWETEFDILKPKKNKKGDRFFRPVDIKNLVMIYDLLRRRKFTIEGAKDFLKNNKKAEEQFEMIQSLEKIKGFLLQLKASL